MKIEVIDSGIGISEEVLPQLFQPFNQGDLAYTKKYGGTGLGLAISRHIAHLLNGELTVKSIYGKGSTFTLIVPAGDIRGVPILWNPAEVFKDVKDDSCLRESGDLSGIRVLLAEDGPDNQELIRILLCKAGAAVEIAENGLVAVNKAEKDSFHVILMDMNMPEMDGYEATRLLRSRGYAGPILALTANAMSGDKERCLSAGCNEHLSKPIDRQEMMQTIARFAAKAIPQSTGEAQIVEEEPPSADQSIVSLYADDPDIVPILGDYVEHLGGQVDEMRTALASGRFADLRRFAHRIKGSGGNYGYPSLTDAAKDLEEAAKMQDARSAEEALHKVASLCRAIRQGYQAYNMSEAGLS